ncbi:MAG TPA: VWA domain-containing protein [Polyangiaceae bacterium]|nr:VWA domain-containing protein [Polyangiaceae bacterium]
MSLGAIRSLVLLLVLLVGCGGSSSFGWSEPPEERWPPPSHDGSAVTVDTEVDDPGTIRTASWGAPQSSSGPLVVLTDPGDLPELVIADREGTKTRRLPLEHTAVKARLAGFVASVEVAQTFQNHHDRPIEVVYVFPLPENSAVEAMEMRIADRVVRAKIKERGEARAIYRRAKERGHTAALLEQERPNIFTQSVANIAPGEKIDVVLRYVQDLSYDAGTYEFVFPMVVGPRFIPGTPLEAAMKGTGAYHDTDRVPDASRITPPVLGKGERSGHDISIEVVADNALPVRGWEVPTHEIVTHQPADGSLRLTLAEKKSIPNRDFVLRYHVAGQEPTATLLTSGEPRDGYFALMVHPPELDVDDLVGQRELVFVLDVSGSMSGTPLGMCKRAMRHALAGLRPVDTFNIITFAGTSRKAFPTPRPVNRTNLDAAMRFIGAARAGGGTHMAEGVRAALSPNVPAGRHRYVFFLTDGYVANEAEIISGSKQLVEDIEGRGQRARVFGFGVGSSVNRRLLTGLSKAGKGLAVYATSREDPARAVNLFYRYIDRAVMTDVRVDWADADVSELYPQPIPDLFASHPIILHGRYASLSHAPTKVVGKVGEREVEIPVEVRRTTAPGARGGLVGTLWARAKVGYLEEESWLGMVPDAQARITKLGLEHAIVTPYTSFVAVDESRRVGDGNPERVVQPVEVPEGVDGAMAGARTQRPAERRPGLAAQPMQEPMAGAEALREMEQRAYSYGGDAADMEAPMASAPGPPPAETSDRGCACRVRGGASGDGGWSVLALLGLALAAWRRREA